MLERLTQEQFEHIIDVLILYKQSNPKKDVYLNEISVKEALYFMQTYGKEFAEQLGMRESSGLLESTNTEDSS